MDFEKIYREFESARAKDDFETMSTLILQATNYGNKLITAGRVKDIAPEVLKIVAYSHVMIHQIMSYINSGRADKARIYLNILAENNVDTFDKFFQLNYLLGKALYATNDFSWAIKLFNRYDEIRAANWNDVDELSLFYQANCFALLGKFQTAAELYELILSIKADFPEAKCNLQIVRQGTNKNLVREISSLWNFPNWRDVPIFINARDRLGVMKKLIDWLLNAGYRKLIILDNLSTYPPLLEYYRTLKIDSRIKIIRLEKNFGHKALWLSNVLEKLKISTPYIYTDPDILPIEDCPKDFVARLMKILDANHEIRKVGLGLVWEDITFSGKKGIQDIESKFYSYPKVDENLYHAQVDTTFALYSNVRHYNLRFSLRTTGDLRAYHLPWYFDYDNLPADEKYYIEHASNSSSLAANLKKSR